jgi:23S rRNA (uracil747-C5)-methyltransferase
MTITVLHEHNYEGCDCAHFTSGACSSCDLLRTPSGRRLTKKFDSVREVFSSFGLPTDCLNPDVVIPSHPWGSRNKVKLSITGTVASPVIGIIRSDLSSVDLRDCSLMTPPCKSFVADLPNIILSAQLTPYDIEARRGELKGVHIVITHDYSQGIIRFVLRSSEAIPRIKKAIQTIQSRHPWVTVISCTIQPLPAATLEGPEEVLLTSEQFIHERYGETTLLYAPSSFIQVTHEVAEKLYRAAGDYAREGGFSQALDLFCGVGGFSLSVAPFVKRVTGVELSAIAIASAQAAATFNGVPNVDFLSADTEDFLSRAITKSPDPKPDLVIINPPRRGLSPSIIEKLLKLTPRSILYSSCNPTTFARDVKLFSEAGGLTLKSAQLFDMFPLTSHCEVLGALASNPPSPAGTW